MARRARSASTRAGLASLAAVLGLAACDGPGAPLTIDEAEQVVERAVELVADGLALERRADRPLGTRTRCELPGAATGAMNAAGTRGIPTADGDALDLAAALVLEAGFDLADPGIEDTVFGRREGMRLTVVLGPTGEVAIDAATACKPLPDR